MKTYIIILELTKPSQEYTSLYKQLDELNARKLGLFLWVVKTDQETNSYDIRDILWKTGIDHKDKILVAEMNWNWAGINICSQGDFPIEGTSILKMIENLKAKSLDL